MLPSLLVMFAPQMYACADESKRTKANLIDNLNFKLFRLWKGDIYATLDIFNHPLKNFKQVL